MVAGTIHARTAEEAERQYCSTYSSRLRVQSTIGPIDFAVSFPDYVCTRMEVRVTSDGAVWQSFVWEAGSDLYGKMIRMAALRVVALVAVICMGAHTNDWAVVGQADGSGDCALEDVEEEIR